MIDPDLRQRARELKREFAEIVAGAIAMASNPTMNGDDVEAWVEEHAMRVSEAALRSVQEEDGLRIVQLCFDKDELLQEIKTLNEKLEKVQEESREACAKIAETTVLRDFTLPGEVVMPVGARIAAAIRGPQ